MMKYNISAQLLQTRRLQISLLIGLTLTMVQCLVVPGSTASCHQQCQRTQTGVHCYGYRDPPLKMDTWHVDHPQSSSDRSSRKMRRCAPMKFLHKPLHSHYNLHSSRGKETSLA